jgi:hypothetical protein
VPRGIFIFYRKYDAVGGNQTPKPIPVAPKSDYKIHDKDIGNAQAPGAYEHEN